jgi:colanic acid/amylovoran biosynthesis glycosyltransferase
MKTIAYVLADFPVLSETFIGNELRAVRALGHPVSPFIMCRGRAPAQPADELLASEALHLDAMQRLPLSLRIDGGGAGMRAALSFVFRQKGLRRRSLVLNATRIAAAARRAGVKHIHAHFAGGAAAHAIVAARLIGATVSFVCHGHDVYAEACDLEAKLEAADFAVAVCQDLATDLGRVSQKARIELIACGADPGGFRPRCGDGNGRLLFVGRLVEQKGIDDLIAALSGMPANERPALDIVGDGPLRQALETAAAGQADTRFLGARDAAWLQQQAPVYEGLVAPFKTARDGSRDTGPLVVKEAMLMGLPVIATRFMGVKETVTPQTGLLVEPGDVAGLGDAVGALLRMEPARRSAMGAAGRKRALAHFTLERQASLLSHLVQAA